MSSPATLTCCVAAPLSLCPTRVYSPGPTGTENSPFWGKVMLSPILAAGMPLPSDKTDIEKEVDRACGSTTRPLRREEDPVDKNVTSIAPTSSPARSEIGVACVRDRL